MFRQLVRKDWRAYRPAVVGGAVLALCPYLVMAVSLVVSPRGGRNPTGDLVDALGEACAFGIGLAFVTAAVFGGMAFAAERRERSADFLAMLPAPRPSIVASKLLVAAAVVVAVATLHLAVYAIATAWDANPRDLPGDFLVKQVLMSLGFGACLLMLLFGLAWALSLNLSSPAIAASVAIGASVVLLFVTGTWAGDIAREYRQTFGDTFAAYFHPAVMAGASLLVGVGAWIFSTVHYVRRVGP